MAYFLDSMHTRPPIHQNDLHLFGQEVKFNESGYLSLTIALIVISAGALVFVGGYSWLSPEPTFPAHDAFLLVVARNRF